MKADFVYEIVLKECLKAGVSQSTSRNAAIVAMNKYKKNSYIGKPSKLIQDAIKNAKKQDRIK